MTAYIYKAKQGPGKTVEGELQAESRAMALAKLDAMGCSPIWVREKETLSGKGERTLFRRIGFRDVTLFTYQLASLTKSGVPILRALSTIRDQTENARFGKIVENIELAIRDGRMLSEALLPYPRLFPELYINMIRSGESAGVLDTVLYRLAEARENEENVRRKVRSAVAYPTLVVLVGVITVFVLFSFFMPKVIKLYSDLSDLPTATKALIGISNIFSRYWYWILMAMILLVAVLKRMAGINKGKLVLDTAALKIPMVGTFLLESDIARFARTLSLLIDAGIPLDRALSLGADTMRNSVLTAEIKKICSETVTQGVPVSDGLKRSNYFPSLVANMSAVGEEAGRLDESLLEVASYYEKQIEQKSRMMTTLLEPILILVVGGIVGFIVAAMLLPIFKLSSGL